jgi:hypothetical protein
MNLKKEKLKVVDKIHSLDNAIKGSVYEMKRFCGKPNCACAKTKTPHTSLVLSFSYKGKTRLIPIKKEQIPGIKARISNYRELKAAIDELTRINAELLRSEE